MDKDKRVIIFDFDGVIVDSLPHYIRIFNQSRLRKSQKPIKIEELRDRNAREIIRSLGLTQLRLPYLARKLKKTVRKEIAGYKPVAEIKSVVHKIKKEYRIGILTTNYKDNVHAFLKTHELELFDFIVTQPRFFKKDRSLRAILKKEGVSRENIVYIGDEIRDVEASKRVGIKSIATTWGFNSKKALKEAGPDFIAEKPKEILSFLKISSY